MLLFSFLLSLAACQEDFTGCDSELTGCHEVDGGRYLSVEPEHTDGPLKVLIYFHGYSSSAKSQVRKSWVEDDLQPRGWLSIFPDGMDNTWSHDGSPSDDRDEIRFLDAVMADVSERWEVEAYYSSGFSQGASMSWYAACYRGDQFAAFFPASGSFWEPLPESCEGGPVNLRHTHGTADGTFPLEGRGIGLSYSQGDTNVGIDLWRDWNGCAEAPDREEVQGEVTCSIWDTCEAGRELRFCLHDGGHSSAEDWMSQNLDWAEGL